MIEIEDSAGFTKDELMIMFNSLTVYQSDVEAYQRDGLIADSISLCRLAQVDVIKSKLKCLVGEPNG